ncbi:hypothetical protein NDN08_003651 [Rhodosorus marinus]|uniref:Sec1 family domain-containing protein 1 n=1 Tax=Rhodosorus marinus TaxID=101924 RepID=A0AAV8UXE2_9RHOD|nr:hypothetical protein NDN08_003651 [Rhodosorus marinus]
MEENLSIAQLQWKCIEGILTSSRLEEGDEDDENGLDGGYGGGRFGRRGFDEEDRDAPPKWKILVYDANGRDLLATLAKVSDLRKLGVTLHMMLDSSRQPIPDVPAVYLCCPTQENLRLIANDCKRNLYDSYHLNFTASIPHEVLEEFAESLASQPDFCASNIKRIYDGYCNFVSLESDLFTLDIPDSYSLLNDRNLKDDAIEGNVERIVSSLFSVVATIGQVPIIRAQTGGPAEMIATALDERIRESLSIANNVFAEASTTQKYSVSPQRLLLVILDRNISLPVMLHHTWTYQALCHDLLQMKLNRVRLEMKEGSMSQTGPRPCDLDKSDEFWKENGGRPFPKVAEAVENALSLYKTEVEEINRKAGSVGGADPQVEGADKLAKALESLPELTKKKQIIDLHTNIATALLDIIKDRNLDAFFHAEDQLMSHRDIEKETIQSLLSTSKGTPDDRMRLFIIYLLCAGSTAEIDSFLPTLKSAGCDLRAVKYVKEIKTFTDQIDVKSTLQNMSLPSRNSVPSTVSDVGLSSMMSSIVEHGSRGLTQVANNFNKLILDEDKALVSGRVVEALMDQKGREDVRETYAYFDPRQPKRSVTRTQKQFREAVVFMVGGGNYVEYQNIKDHLKGDKHVLYGCTDLVTGESFLRQLEKLSGEAKEEPSQGEGAPTS